MLRSGGAQQHSASREAWRHGICFSAFFSQQLNNVYQNQHAMTSLLALQPQC